MHPSVTPTMGAYRQVYMPAVTTVESLMKVVMAKPTMGVVLSTIVVLVVITGSMDPTEKASNVSIATLKMDMLLELRVVLKAVAGFGCNRL